MRSRVTRPQQDARRLLLLVQLACLPTRHGISRTAARVTAVGLDCAPSRPVRLRRLGRLPCFDYGGSCRYLLTFCKDNRRPAFSDGEVVSAVLLQLRHHAAVRNFAVLAYCFMPDHLHVLVAGTATDACLPAFVAAFKQASGHGHVKMRRQRLWQSGYQDRVLRGEESTEPVIRYILANPVRAGIAQRPADYPHSGSDLFPAEKLTWEDPTQG